VLLLYAHTRSCVSPRYRQSYHRTSQEQLLVFTAILHGRNGKINSHATARRDAMVLIFVYRGSPQVIFSKDAAKPSLDGGRPRLVHILAAILLTH
jgi:hypothetical protein